MTICHIMTLCLVLYDYLSHINKNKIITNKTKNNLDNIILGSGYKSKEDKLNIIDERPIG